MLNLIFLVVCVLYIAHIIKLKGISWEEFISKDTNEKSDGHKCKEKILIIILPYCIYYVPIIIIKTELYRHGIIKECEVYEALEEILNKN